MKIVPYSWNVRPGNRFTCHERASDDQIDRIVPIGGIFRDVGPQRHRRIGTGSLSGRLACVDPQCPVLNLTGERF